MSRRLTCLCVWLQPGPSCAAHLRRGAQTCHARVSAAWAKLFGAASPRRTHVPRACACGLGQGAQRSFAGAHTRATRVCLRPGQSCSAHLRRGAHTCHARVSKAWAKLFGAPSPRFTHMPGTCVCGKGPSSPTHLRRGAHTSRMRVGDRQSCPAHLRRGAHTCYARVLAAWAKLFGAPSLRACV